MIVTASHTGTAREQWELARIDVALGRITAAELHELGSRLLREMESVDSDEVERLKHEVVGLEDDLREAHDDVDEATKEIRELKQRVRELEASRA